MPDVAENLRTFLLADSDISNNVGTRVGQNHAQQDWIYPRIVYFRTGSENERTLDESAGVAPFRNYFDVEIVSDDIDEAADVAELVKALDGSSGTFGTQTVQGVFVEDHDDTYVPRSLDEEDALHVAALRIEVVGAS